jgi:hypothetical protein
MKSVIYVHTKTLTRDLVDAGLSLCIIKPLTELIENRDEEMFQVSIRPFIINIIREELSGSIIIDSSVYEILDFEENGEFSIILVPKW